MFDRPYRGYLCYLLHQGRVKLVHMLLEKHGMDTVDARRDYIEKLKRY